MTISTHVISYSSCGCHVSKDSPRREEIVRSVALHQSALLQHHHLVVVHHGVDPVCDGQHRAGREVGLDGSLYEVVRPQVQASRGLVQQ